MKCAKFAHVGSDQDLIYWMLSNKGDMRYLYQTFNKLQIGQALLDRFRLAGVSLGEFVGPEEGRRLAVRGRVIALCVFLLAAAVAHAQAVGYSYKPLATDGCSVKYSVARQDSTYYIVATVKSDRLNFLKESTMLIKTFAGEVIKLQGTQIGSGSESSGVMIGFFFLPVTEVSSTAQFRITPAQFERIRDGVAKVRLSTTPIEHERAFKKDKIGKKLYQFYLKQRDKENDF